MDKRLYVSATSSSKHFRVELDNDGDIHVYGDDGVFHQPYISMSLITAKELRDRLIELNLDSITVVEVVDN